MGGRRMRGLVVVGVLMCVLGLTAIWFIGGWPAFGQVANGAPRLDDHPNPFAMMVAFFGATMGCCGLVVLVVGIVGALLVTSRAHE